MVLPLISALPLVVACTSSSNPDDTGPGDSGSTADFTVDADVTVVDTAATVMTVTWTSDAPSVDAATVNVQSASGDAWTQDATDGDAFVWGFKPGDEVTVTVTVESGGQAATSAPFSTTTSAADSSLPTLTVTGDGDGALDGGLLLTTNVQGPGAAVLIDTDGDYRWWAFIEDGKQIGRARLDVTGQSILAMPVNNSDDVHIGIHRFALDGSLIETIAMDRMHHDFVQHSDGTLAFFVRDTQPQDGRAITGDSIVEWDPTDGSFTTIWSIWDTHTFTESKGPSETEWTHANALVFDEAEQVYYGSMLGMHAIIKIDRATGAALWTLGSPDSDFENTDGGHKIMETSHQFQFLDGSMLLFENGESERASSRAVELSFDESQPVIEELWEYEPDPSLYAYAMGDVWRLDGGDTVIDFSTSGQVMQVTDAGETVWQLNASIGGAFGYMTILHGVAGH